MVARKGQKEIMMTDPAPVPTPPVPTPPVPDRQVPAPVDPPKDPAPELTWESLADKGIKSPADVLAQLDKERGHARTWEDRAKGNLGELEKLRRERLTEDERARAELSDKVRAEVTSELTSTLGIQLAEVSFQRAAAGKVADVDAALDVVAPAEKDGSRPGLKSFLKDDGSVDGDRVSAAVERIAKLSPGSGQTPPPHVDRNGRTGGKPDQLTRADLKDMKPQEIMKAQSEGRMDDLLGIKR